MTATANQPIGSFLDSLAAKQSTPGGGGAAALTGAQAAALVSMVINFTIGNKKYADVECEMQEYLTQSEALRQTLTELADRDVEAFNAVSACYGMAKSTDEEKAKRTVTMQSALKGAAEVPFEIAQACLDVIKLAGPVGKKGNANVVADAASALYLAYAGLQGAFVNVNINLKYIKDADYVEKWATKRDDILAEAEAQYESGRAACTQTLGITI